MDGNNNILGNELQITQTPDEEVNKTSPKKIQGIEVFSGEALTDFELYRKSTQTNVNSYQKM